MYYLDTYSNINTTITKQKFSSKHAHFEAYKQKKKKHKYKPLVPASLIKALLLATAVAAVLFLSLRKKIGVTATAVFLALSIALFAYFDFLVGNRVFIFSDIASDSCLQFWPMMTHLSRRIWSGELPMWTF